MDEKTALLYEQLCLAAKAAGLLVESYYPEPFCLVVYEGEGETFKWSPRADDGDALRLLVRMCVLIGTIKMLDGLLRAMKEEKGKHDDPYSGMRASIVRAAAEIGEKMA